MNMIMIIDYKTICVFLTGTSGSKFDDPQFLVGL